MQVNGNRYLAMVLAALVSTGVVAQDATTFEEQYKLIRAPNAAARIGIDLFGDHVNLYNGSLEFIQNDVSLRGNNSLPVAAGRRLETGKFDAGGRAFGRWDLEIPHLHGVFGQADGWKSAAGDQARCSAFGPPPGSAGSAGQSFWEAREFWQGNFIYVPGVGDQRIMRRASDNTEAPGKNPSAYPLVTSQSWALRCLPSLANDTSSGKTSGEGFVAIAPDGTQYQFDWLTSYRAVRLTKAPDAALRTPTTTDTSASKESPQPSTPADAPSATQLTPQLMRKEVWILPTKVTDRFGNTVSYTYDPVKPANVMTITSSDQRKLTFSYGADAAGNSVVSSVTDGTRTWRYAYDGSEGGLSVVTLPDHSTLQVGGIGRLLHKLAYAPGVASTCDSPNTPSLQPLSGTMIHPSGATGSFILTPTKHGRSAVEFNCVYLADSQYAEKPRTFFTYSLTKKTISGPGLPATSWSYDYGVANGSWAPCDTGAGCVDTKTVVVTDPNGDTLKYRYGNRFKVTEGQLQQADVIEGDGTVQRSTQTGYKAAGAGPYPMRAGIVDFNDGDEDMSALNLPSHERITTQQGATFTWQATDFDTLVRPKTVTRSSSLGMKRVERTEYADNYPKWVLGQVERLTETTTGKLVAYNTFDPTTASVLTKASFGKRQQSFTYYADGTLATRTDAGDNTTSFSAYKRGIPQTVKYPDTAIETAVVSNIGTVTSLTNPLNATTSFSYDEMGRLAGITYPAADSVAWNPTTILFEQVNSQEYDLAAGHWRQTVTTGNARTTSYFDGLWRPVYSYTADLGNVGATSRIVKHQYDFGSRTTFDSYPQRDYGQIAGGVTTAYDALGRVTRVSADSELGVLNTYSAYSSPFQKTVTDARGNSTTSSFHAFDEPSESAIARLQAPEGVTVDIARDVFGKPTAITRSGGGKSATRRYVYDRFERLCTTIEPETGATVQDYDAANNVAWRATGLARAPTAPCDTNVAEASKMKFGYDPMHRLKTTAFGDGSPGISRTYTLDGQPDTITSNGVLWSNSYNKRRLREREGMAYGGATYVVDRAYDANGSLRRLTYPDQTSIDYAPNALGEPSRAGSFASAVTYYPNGAIASFRYGNGIVHTLAQNTRGLPEVSTDAGVLNDKYGYDENANVKSNVDQQEGISSRAMVYDNLDRLTQTTSAATFGVIKNGYDALDNLISFTVSQGPTARSTILDVDAVTNRIKTISGATAAYNLDYEYDGQGNVTRRGVQRFVFDQGNRLKSATGKATYAYDGLGHRVSTVGADGVNRVAVYTQDGVLLYTRATSVPLTTGTRYIYLGRHQVAEVKAAGAN
jgi:YD repeat-containing protein